MSEWQALALAFAFGIGYNWLISRWGQSQYGDGLTALWVVLGVAITLAISATVRYHQHVSWLHIQWQGEVLTLTNAQHAAWYELKFFIASGIPMVIGSLWRYISNFSLTIEQ